MLHKMVDGVKDVVFKVRNLLLQTEMRDPCAICGLPSAEVGGQWDLAHIHLPHVILGSR